jgi:hypothetical protein
MACILLSLANKKSPKNRGGQKADRGFITEGVKHGIDEVFDLFGAPP